MSKCWSRWVEFEGFEEIIMHLESGAAARDQLVPHLVFDGAVHEEVPG